MADTPANIRLLAVQVATSVVKDGVSLSELLPAAQESLAPREAALLQELVFGVTRWSYRLDCELGYLLKKPLRSKETDLKVLLWLALYEIQFMRTPDYAAVDAYAGLTVKLRKKWAKSLVNGVLRQFLRSQSEIVKKATQSDSGRTSLPNWITSQLKSDWPEHLDDIVEASNKRAPLVLRVNRRHRTREQYRQLLKAEAVAGDELQCHEGELGAESLIIDTPVRVQSLAGFDDGFLSVQDSAAQLAAGLIAPQAGQRILDACAAPGGKTCHLLELQAECTVTAIDSSESRMKRVRENLQRLELTAELLCADAADLDSWWNGEPFDAVLLDAPCSALGVLRRHPDIRLLRRETDIDALVVLQQKLLAALWQAVRPGGKLVYATCSVLKRENEQQIIDFLAVNENATELNIDAGWGQACAAGRQILPGQHEADGFYYAIIEKKSVEDAR